MTDAGLSGRRLLLAGKIGPCHQGRGANLHLSASLAGPVVVLMKKARHGVCWQSTFKEPFRQNNDHAFSAAGD